MNVTQIYLFFYSFHLVNKFWETTVLICCHEKIKTCKKHFFFSPNDTCTGFGTFCTSSYTTSKRKKEKKKNIMYTSFYSELKVSEDD